MSDHNDFDNSIGSEKKIFGHFKLTNGPRMHLHCYSTWLNRYRCNIGFLYLSFILKANLQVYSSYNNLTDGHRIHLHCYLS